MSSRIYTYYSSNCSVQISDTTCMPRSALTPKMTVTLLSACILDDVLLLLSVGIALESGLCIIQTFVFCSSLRNSVEELLHHPYSLLHRTDSARNQSAEIIIRLESYSGTTSDTPVNTVWVERHKTTITSQTTKKSLREGTLYFGEERLGFSHKEVDNHSIRSGFAMELYLDKVYPEKIMIMGCWASSAFLRYICIQVSDLSKGISTLMTNNHALYTIPEIEVVYHTPGQPSTDPQMMRLNKRG